MSKPMIVRVAFFVLVSLALIAATSAGVRGWLNGAAPLTGSHTVNGLQTDFNHQRSTVAELQGLQLQNGASDQPASPHQGGCHSDNRTSPQD